MDPRFYQISTLSALCLWGVIGLDHGVDPAIAAAIALTAMVTQLVGCRATGATFDPKSPLISTLSLILLLRTHSLWIAVAAATIAIGGKFLVRVGDKHVFNPANVGIVACLLLFDGAWVSPGRWLSLIHI